MKRRPIGRWPNDLRPNEEALRDVNRRRRAKRRQHVKRFLPLVRIRR